MLKYKFIIKLKVASISSALSEKIVIATKNKELNLSKYAARRRSKQTVNQCYE